MCDTVRMSHFNTRDRKVLERRRMRAARLFDAGVSQYAVAKRLGVSTAAANQWHHAWEERGADGLKTKGPPGFDPAYDAAKRKKLRTLVLSSPRSHGYDTDFWTIERIRTVARTKFKVRLRQTQTWRTLVRCGFSCQKPERRAKERDENAIRYWRTVTFPRLKKMG
ncbi:transposase [Candidatus Kaiserbacteria bacterium]|nr:transposase [Candidatus Kaiserbacteria bacterium]